MDISNISISMTEGALKTAVQLSVLKLGMDSNKQISNTMTEMMSNMASEPNKGINLDKMV